jgi:hypothetical protein
MVRKERLLVFEEIIVKHKSFNGPVDDKGNAIRVPQGNRLTDSDDGKSTGTRKDGGHPLKPKHPDSRAWEPHTHVSGITNPDGT